MTTLFPDSDELTGAEFSSDRRYRYRLWRKWDSEKPMIAWIGLNPSTANEVENDPTVTRCIERAKRLNFGGMVMLNLFAFRATDPAAMKREPEPIGELNNWHLRRQAAGVDTVVCCWGTHGGHLDRALDVERSLRTVGIKLHHLGLTKDGFPKHPLYLSYDVKLREWRA